MLMVALMVALVAQLLMAGHGHLRLHTTTARLLRCAKQREAHCSVRRHGCQRIANIADAAVASQ